MAYLYRHVRLDKNEPFYIGIGSDNNYRRAHSSKQRSYFWGRTVISCDRNYKVEVLLEDLSWEEACEKEKEFILLYGRRDLKTGSLCNLTEGGEGAYGRFPSKETRDKISRGVSGPKHGMYGKTHTPEARRKIIAGITSDRYTKERSEKISKNTKGVKKTMTKKFLMAIEKRKGAGTWCSKPVINSLTGEKYSCIREAADSYNMRADYLRMKLSGTHKNNTPFKYL